jgi:hypothetical protein
MPTKQGLDIGAAAATNRLDQGDGFAPPDNGDPFAPVFHRVKEVSEVTGGVGGTHFSHGIRLSDYPCFRREI